MDPGNSSSQSSQSSFNSPIIQGTSLNPNYPPNYGFPDPNFQNFPPPNPNMPMYYNQQMMPPPQFNPNQMMPPPSTPIQFQTQTETPTGSEAQTQSPSEKIEWLTPEESSKKRKSAVWAHYIISKCNLHAKCKTCGNKFSAKTSSGTGHVKRHAEKCGIPASDPAQPRISASHPFGFVYNADRDRDELGKMLVHSETPFLFSENDAFNRYINVALQPQHKKIGRKAVTSSAMRNYLALKEKLKFELGSHLGRVSLTADSWDGGYGLHYLCVTCHWVDHEWNLQKRIIHFKVLEYPHNGVNIANHLNEAIDTYGLREKIMSMTFDNASSMTYCANLIKPNLRDFVLNEEALHVRCACHVLNLCVQDGLRAIGPYQQKVREAVLCINSSGARLQEWKAFLRQAGKKVIRLKADCPTRWNSTYEMLSKAIMYKDPITRFFNSRFPQLALTDDDWAKCEKYMTFLQLLYSMTHSFSTVYQPCSQSFLTHACLLGNLFYENKFSEDYEHYVPLMEEKWRKYFDKIPLIYIYASILDPRQKYNGTFRLLNIYSQSMHDYSSTEMEAYQTEITNKFFSLYQVYATKYGTQSAPTPSQSKSGGKRAKNLFSQVTNLVNKFQSSSDSSVTTQSDLTELHMYQQYEFMKGLDDDAKSGLDLLAWWKEQEPKHPILAAMARDVLAIQVSSVASERAFSASGRVLNDQRSRLKPDTLEMCVCYKDWLDAENRAQDRSYEMQDNYDESGTSDATSTSSQSSQLYEDLEDEE